MGRGLRHEDVSSRQEDVFRANLCCLLNYKSFGGSMVKTRRCSSRQEDVF